MFSNRRQDGCSHTEPEAVKFPVAEIPHSFQLDHVSTLFAKVSLLKAVYSSTLCNGLPKFRKWSGMNNPQGQGKGPEGSFILSLEKLTF